MSVSSGHPVLDIAMKISDASIARYRIVQGDTSNTTNTDMVAKAATGETTRPIGVTIEATTVADQTAGVRVAGVALVEVNGTSAIDIGDMICATSAGIGVIATAADATAQYPVGIALAPSAASGDVIPVLLTPGAIIVKGTA